MSTNTELADIIAEAVLIANEGWIKKDDGTVYRLCGAMRIPPNEWEDKLAFWKRVCRKAAEAQQ